MKKEEVKITITTDTQTAGAVLGAIEAIAKDETVDSSGIKNVEVKASPPELPKGI